MNFKFLFLPAFFLFTVGLVIWWYLSPAQIGYAIAVATAGYALGAWWLDRDRHDWWQLAFLPVFLFASATTYGLLISARPALIIFAALLVIAETVYWRFAYLYALRPSSYPAFALERLSFYVNFAIIFCASAAAFGVRTFLGIRLGIIAPLFALIIALIVYQWAWISKVEWKSAWRHIVVFAVIMTELFFIASFLPLDFNVLGFLLATSYYAFISLAANQLEHTLDGRRVKLIFAVVGASWLIVLLTARWI